MHDAVAADMGRRIDLVVGNLLHAISCAIGYAENCHIGFEPVEVEAQREIMEGLEFPAGSHAEDLCHVLLRLIGERSRKAAPSRTAILVPRADP